jgi:hypothetical protein
MHIRPLVPGDIPAAAALLRHAAEEFILHESTPEGASVFLAEQGEEGMRGFLASGFVYHVAEVDGTLAGFIAIRERSDAAIWPDHPGAFTVNASNHAVPFYASLGFVPTAPTQYRVVHYNPMRLVVDSLLIDPA